MIIISLGGSVIVPETVDVNFLKKFKALILKHVKQGKKFILITGGGKTCRKYQQAAGKVNKIKTLDLDLIGIATTRLNAELVRSIFGDKAFDTVVYDPTKKCKTNKPIIIGAGWKPGCSTDKDAVLFAQAYKANKVINVSNVSYVYDKDPNKFKDAKKLKSLTWTQLQKIVGTKWIPGLNAPFDPMAAKLAKKMNLEVAMTAKDLANLDKIIQGKPFIGTNISGI